MRWIIVADSTCCRIFAQEHEHGAVREVENLVRPENRLTDHAHYADRPGRAFDSIGAGRHSMERPSSARDDESEKFAQTIAGKLDSARKENAVDGVVLMVEPQLLGRIRAKLTGHVRKLVELEIPANLTRANADRIRTRFFEAMRRR